MGGSPLRRCSGQAHRAYKIRDNPWFFSPVLVAAMPRGRKQHSPTQESISVVLDSAPGFTGLTENPSADIILKRLEIRGHGITPSVTFGREIHVPGIPVLANSIVT